MCRVLICPSGHHCPEGLTCMLVFAIFAAVLGMFQFGFNTGVINTPQEVLTEFIDEIYRERTGEFITAGRLDLIWSITVSIFAIGGMIGGLSGGTIADWCGRKCGLLLNNAIAILGATLMSSSKLFKSVECLIIGRFFIGLNCGLNTHLVPMYLSEIAPMNLRGALGTVSQLGVTTGLLLAQVLGLNEILGTADGWPFLLGVAFVPAVLQLMLLPLCPESPRYLLITKGRVSEARKALTRLRCTTEVDEDIEEMRMEESRASSSASNLLTHNQQSYSSSLGRNSLAGADQIYYHNNGTIGHHFTPNHAPYGGNASSEVVTATTNQSNSNYHHPPGIQHHLHSHSHGGHNIISNQSDHHHAQQPQQPHSVSESPSNSSPSDSYSILSVILNPDLRMPLIIAIAMQLSQQLSGINAIFYYSTEIFTKAGLEADKAKYATLGVGSVMVVMTLVSIPLMDKMGRRTLHLWGLGGMFITSLFFTISMLVGFLYTGMSYVSIISSLLFVVFFAVGPGSIPWLITAELFSQGPRPAAISIAVLINWSTNFIVGLTFPLMRRALEHYAFLPFTCFLAIFWTFTYHRVPETKNRTFEEISLLFKQTQSNLQYTNETDSSAFLVQQQQQHKLQEQQQQQQVHTSQRNLAIEGTSDTPRQNDG